MNRIYKAFTWVFALMLMLSVITFMPQAAKATGVELSVVCTPRSMPKGGQVEIEVTVTNETDMALEGVTVSYGGYSAKLGNIDPGDSSYDEGMITISDSQLGKDIAVDVTYTTGGLADTQRTFVRVEKEESATPPSVNFTRSASTKQASPGDSVTFTYEVKNNSSDAITNVSIADPAASGVASGDTIAAGQSKKYTANVTVNNDVTSTPKLTYAYNGQSYDKTLDPITVAVAKASLSITATAEKTTVNKGDTITFTVKLNNSGQTKVTGIKLVDDKGEVIRSSATVNAGASPSVSHSIKFEESRSVVFTATYASGSETATATSDPIEVKVEGSEVQGNGRMSIVSVETDPAEPELPGNVTFTVSIRNEGDITLTNVQVNEESLGRIGTLGELNPGETKQVSKQTRVSEETSYVFSAVASDDGGNAYEAGTKSITVTGTAVQTETPQPSESMTPAPTVAPAGDGLKTMLIAVVIIVVLIIIAAIALVVLMMQERKAKKLAEEQGEDYDPDNPDDDFPQNKDNPQQVDGVRPPPRRRPEGERRGPESEHRRPEGEQQRRMAGERPRRPEDGQQRRPQQPREDLERTQAIPSQYRNRPGEDTQEIPTGSGSYEEAFIEERPRRNRPDDYNDQYRRPDDGYNNGYEERPRRREEGNYNDYEERPRRKRPADTGQQRKEQPRRKPAGTEDDLNYGPPKRRRKKRDEE